MPSEKSPAYFSIGSIILDDITLAGGEVMPDVLGGGALHAAMGMRVWSDRVALLAKVARDFQFEDHPLLAKQINTSGIRRASVERTPHTRQFFGEDGSRSEEFLTPLEEMLGMIPRPADLPEAWNRLKGVHLHCRLEDLPEWVELLRGRGNPLVLWEPPDRFACPENLGCFLGLGRLVDWVSPNLNEMRSLTGIEEPVKMARFCLEEGIKGLLLRMGEDGCLVTAADNLIVGMPAEKVEKVVDTTGAGNACCGGFVAGMAEKGDPIEAARMGNHSAALALRQFGALYQLESQPEA